jgi:hypothetical protein
VHHDRIVFPSEDVSRPAHIGSELVNLGDAADGCLNQFGISQVALNKFVRGRLGEFVPFDVYGSNPAPFGLEPFDEMPADKPTRAIYQYSFHRRLHTSFLNFIDMIAGATPQMGCAGARAPG